MVCPDLTMLQRAAGLVTWLNFVQLAGIGLAVAGILFFCSGLIRRFLLNVRLIEALLWGLTSAGVASGFFIPNGYQLWTVLTGCLLFPGALLFSMRERHIPIKQVEVWRLLAAVWGATALFYRLEAIGFITVMAVLVLLGLSIAVGPCCYALGFKDKEAVPRGTLAGAFLAIVYALLTAAKVDMGVFGVFQSGALWLGSFAWFLGVLIISVARYPGGNYPTRQLIALVSLVGGLSVGLLSGIRELSTMASTFLLFYLAGKIIEVPVHGRIGFGLKLIATGGLMSSVWYVSLQAKDVLEKYLAMPL